MEKALGFKFPAGGTLRSWLPAALFHTNPEESRVPRVWQRLGMLSPAQQCSCSEWLGRDVVDLPWNLFGFFAKHLQITSRSNLGSCFPRQALCTTASPGASEEAARNGMSSRGAKLRQDLMEEQRSHKQDACLSDFLQQHLSLSSILVPLRQII